MKITAACIGATLLAPLALARPEPNAFLNHLAPDMNGIIHQVQSDPVVYARYEKHFGMTKGELVSYFATLRPSKITKSGPYTVYNIHEDGIVRSRVFNLKAGSLIYIDSVGRPILKKVCGNPMAMSPKKLAMVNVMNELPISPPAELKPIEETAPEAETPNELMVAEELAQPPIETPTPPIATTPPTVETPPAIVPEVKPSFEVAPLGGGWILPLLSGAVILAGGGGGGGTSVVPEPTTLVATVTLVGLLSARRLRKRR